MSRRQWLWWMGEQSTRVGMRQVVEAVPNSKGFRRRLSAVYWQEIAGWIVDA